MGLFDRLRVETKAARPGASAAAMTNALSGTHGARFGGLALDQDNVEAVVQGHYRRVVIVFRCVDAIASAQASLPMHVYDSRDTNAKQVDGHQHVEWLLNNRPNSYETAWQFRYRISTLLLLSQMGVFVEMVEDKETGRTAELHIIAPDSCQPMKDAKTYVKGYRVRTEGGYRDLPPDKVIWIRGRPHPTDPWKQIVPISSAAMSADTDYLVNVFNTKWLSNDGRPSLLIGLHRGDNEGGYDDDDIDALKRRFSGGPSRAGETSVIEADKVNVADLAGSPKDMQYQALSDMSSKQILMAYGLSYSFLAWAEGKTFNNSDSENEAVWLKTMPGHCDPIAQAFEVLLPGGAEPTVESDVIRHDFSQVSEMQRASRLEADRALAEFQAGTMTLDEYHEKVGREKWNVPATRVLWVPNVGPVGRNDKDTEAARELLKAGKPDPMILPPGADEEAVPALEGAATPPLAGRPAALSPARRALPPGRQSQQDFAGAKPGTRPATQGDLQALRGSLRAVMSERQAEQVQSRLLAAAKTRLVRSPEHKSARFPRTRRDRTADDDVLDAEVVADEWDDPSEHLTVAVADDLTRALGGVCRRMLGSIDGRLSGTKARKGTRHWTPDAEEKAPRKPLSPLSEFYVAQVDRWSREVQAEVRRLIRDGASRAMADLRIPTGIDAAGIVRASKLVQQLTNRLTADLERGIARRVRDIQKAIRELDDAGATIDEIKDRVAAEQGRLDRWVEQVAPRVARAAVQGARKIMIDRVSDSRGVAVWITRGDHRVRDTHVAAHGQTVKRGHAFVVGGARMMFPGDPRGPAREWAGCRCVTAFRRSDGQVF